MPNQKRCKKCNTPIDDGELCSVCQIRGPKVEGMTREEMRLGLERGKDACKNATYEAHHPEYFK